MSEGLAPDAKVQIGLPMPSQSDMDFDAVGPKPLVAVEASPEARSGAGAAADGGELQLAIGADVHTGRWSVRSGPSASRSEATWVPVAWAAYNNTVKQNGWAYLSLRTAADPHVSVDMKMYAAGFLEGFATARQIRDFRHNAGVLMQSDEEKH